MTDYGKLLQTWKNAGHPRRFTVHKVEYMHQDTAEGPIFTPVGEHAAKAPVDLVTPEDRAVQDVIAQAREQAARAEKQRNDDAIRTALEEEASKAQSELDKAEADFKAEAEKLAAEQEETAPEQEEEVEKQEETAEEEKKSDAEKTPKGKAGKAKS